MRYLILTISLILFANTVAAATLTISHDKKLPTPHDLITKGKILDKQMDDDGTLLYYINWDKTDDFYGCTFFFDHDVRVQRVRCHLAEQETVTAK